MADESTFPSGSQFEIRGGGYMATVVEVGGGLRSLRRGDTQILDGFDRHEMCRDGRGQLLIPWPNRLAGGKYQFEGNTYQTPINDVKLGNANHGLVRWANWHVRSREDARISLCHRLYPSPGYPFILDLYVTYSLAEDGLSVALEARNSGSQPCPFGAGQHPYMFGGEGGIEHVSLTVPAATTYRTDDQLIPIERMSVSDTALDYRQPRPIGDAQINMDFTDLHRDGDGRATVALTDADTGRTTDVWLDEAFGHVMIYTGDTVQPLERRRQSVAVEPMTCPPNAFVTGEDLIVLAPGDIWRGAWGACIRP